MLGGCHPLMWTQKKRSVRVRGPCEIRWARRTPLLPPSASACQLLQFCAVRVEAQRSVCGHTHTSIGVVGTPEPEFRKQLCAQLLHKLRSFLGCPICDSRTNVNAVGARACAVTSLRSLSQAQVVKVTGPEIPLEHSSSGITLL